MRIFLGGFDLSKPDLAIIHQTSEGRIEDLSTRALSLLHYLQIEAERRGFSCETITVPLNLQVFPAHAIPVRALILLQMPRSDQWEIFHSPKLPFALFDEGDNELQEVFTVASARFAFSNLEAGKRIGRRLLDTGHRRIAYLTHYASERWSADRLVGLKEVFQAPGLGNAVEVIESTSTNTLNQGLYYQNRSLDNEVKRYLTPDDDPELFRSMVRRMYRVRMRETQRVTGLLLAKRAFGLDDITAWVACNDDLAACAHTFLESTHGEGFQEMNRNIELIGFDNSALAHQDGFASFGFDFPVLAANMVDFAMTASRVGDSGGQRVQRIEAPTRLFPPEEAGPGFEA